MKAHIRQLIAGRIARFPSRRLAGTGEEFLAMALSSKNSDEILIESKRPLCRRWSIWRFIKKEETYDGYSPAEACRPERAFPVNLDPFVCTRTEIAELTKKAMGIGTNFFGLCCGAAPHHIRAMAETLGAIRKRASFRPT